MLKSKTKDFIAWKKRVRKACLYVPIQVKLPDSNQSL